jgi:rhomboid protease GluP
MSEPDPPPPVSAADPAETPEAAEAPTSQAVPSAVNRAAAFHQALVASTPKVWVAHTLLAINALIFVVMIASGVGVMTPTNDSLIKWGANYGPRTTSGEWWRLLTCTFLHAGVIHVGMNMVVLFNIGPFVERLTGNVSFLILYLFAGLAGSVASIAWQPHVLSVGASGAVFGMYGALLGFLLRGKGSIPREVLAELQKSALVFLGYNLIFGLTQKGIDMAAHVGGLAGGFAGGLVLSHPISTEGVRGRLRRGALLAVVGFAAIAALTQVLPHGADVQAAIERFGTSETKILGIVNDTVKKAQDGKLSDAEFATVLETEVIPAWHAAREELSGMKRIPPESEKLVTQVTRYMDAREEGWKLFAAGLRNDDMATIEKAKAKQTEAEGLIKEIGK